MIHAQRTKYVTVIHPAAIRDNLQYPEVEIDCVNFDHLTVVAYLGATDIAMAALEIQETDTTGAGEANVTGLVYGTSNDITGTLSVLPSATDDDSFFIFEIDLRGRKRFLSLVATAGDGTVGTFLAAFGILSRAEDGPFSASDKGVANVLRV